MKKRGKAGDEEDSSTSLYLPDQMHKTEKVRQADTACILIE